MAACSALCATSGTGIGGITAGMDGAGWVVGLGELASGAMAGADISGSAETCGVPAASATATINPTIGRTLMADAAMPGSQPRSPD